MRGLKPIVLDFETYYNSDYTLSKLTTEQYIRRPEFEVIGVGLYDPINNKRVWMEHERFKRKTQEGDWAGFAMLCHHAHFDGLVLKHHYGVAPGLWLDTLSMANAIHGQARAKNLDALAEHYGVGRKGTEVHTAKGKHRADFTAAEWTQYGEYCLHDCWLAWQIFLKMLPGFPEVDLRLIDITVRMFTEPAIMLDIPLLEGYLAYEQQRKQELLDRLKLDRGVFMSNDKFAALLRSLGVEPDLKWTQRKNKETGLKEPAQTFAFAKSDPFMQDLVEDQDDEIRWIAETRIAIKSTGAETRTVRFIRAAQTGPYVPVYLRFCAAHTTRWGGGDKLNFQNPGKRLKDSHGNRVPWSGTLRDAIMAPPGHSIVVADASQIEARYTAYVAGEQWLLDAFRDRRDVYSEFASDAYGRKVDRKNVAADEVPGFVGKTCTLGLGYGMGFIRLALTFLKGALGGPPLQFTQADAEQMGVDWRAFLTNPRKVQQVREAPTRHTLAEMLVHCMCCDHLVTKYRRRNRRVEALWQKMATLLSWMATIAEGEEYDAGLPIPTVVRRHEIQIKGCLPLHYHGLEMRSGERRAEFTYIGGKSGREVVYIHGAAATENYIQYASRYSVAHAMVPYSERHKIAFMSHDEVVSAVRTAQAQEALDWQIELLSTPPAWAPGIPLAAEGGIGQRYGEVK